MDKQHALRNLVCGAVLVFRLDVPSHDEPVPAAVEVGEGVLRLRVDDHDMDPTMVLRLGERPCKVRLPVVERTRPTQPAVVESAQTLRPAPGPCSTRYRIWSPLSQMAFSPSSGLPRRSFWMRITWTVFTYDAVTTSSVWNASPKPCSKLDQPAEL